mgnify:CR=1 FL=1
MLLAADVGNTNVKLGIFDGDNLKFKLRFQPMKTKQATSLPLNFSHFCRFTTLMQKH